LAAMRVVPFEKPPIRNAVVERRPRAPRHDQLADSKSVGAVVLGDRVEATVRVGIREATDLRLQGASETRVADTPTQAFA
jgi:hypothetical protein